MEITPLGLVKRVLSTSMNLHLKTFKLDDCGNTAVTLLPTYPADKRAIISAADAGYSLASMAFLFQILDNPDNLISDMLRETWSQNRELLKSLIQSQGFFLSSQLQAPDGGFFNGVILNGNTLDHAIQIHTPRTLRNQLYGIYGLLTAGHILKKGDFPTHAFIDCAKAGYNYMNKRLFSPKDSFYTMTEEGRRICKNPETLAVLLNVLRIVHEYYGDKNALKLANYIIQYLTI
jgi:hypothetical protein